jgi:hypothetical protein
MFPPRLADSSDDDDDLPPLEMIDPSVTAAPPVASLPIAPPTAPVTSPAPVPAAVSQPLTLAQAMQDLSTLTFADDSDSADSDDY